MPRFAYAAIDANGQSVEGVTKASTIGEARAFIQSKSLYPVKIEEKRGSLSFELTKEKVKKKELMHFTRQLAVFVKAGIPITEALETIGDETEDIALRRCLSSMVEDLRNGGRLSSAARKHPEAFPIYYIGRLDAAAPTAPNPPGASPLFYRGPLEPAQLPGRLDETLESLAGYLEREVETRAKVVS